MNNSNIKTTSFGIALGFFTKHTHFSAMFISLTLLIFPLQSLLMTKQQAYLITSFTKKKTNVNPAIVRFLVTYAALNILKAILGVLSSQMRPLFVKYCRNELINLIENGCERGCHQIKPAEILQKMMNIPWELYDVVHQITTSFMPDIIILITTSISITSINHKIGGVSLVSVILTIIISYFHMRKFNFKDHELKEMELFETYDEKIHSLFDIFAQNNFDFEKMKMKKSEDAFFNTNQKEIVLKTKTIGSTKFIAFMFFVVSFSIFSKHYTKYTDTDITTLIASILQFSFNLTTLADNILSSYHVYYEVVLINKFLEQFTQNAPSKNAKSYGIKNSTITFDNVSFKYGSRTILSNFSCTLNKGQINCIVGKSGIGKSTIVYMISGFNNSYLGRIQIDDHDIRNLSLKYIRENISICGQSSFIQNSTIRENLIYGHESQNEGKATQTKIITDILKRHNLLSYFDSFENRLETDISNASISGGQKQIINFCRVLIRNTNIMIFDEPTSALNHQLSLKCIDVLEQLSLSKTIILITHIPQFHKESYNIIHINSTIENI